MSASAQRRFSWNSGARVAYPRWKSVALIELTGVVLIVAAGAASQLGAGQEIMAKVRMMEALEHVRVGKVAAAEHFAITGRALPSDMFGKERFAQVDAVPEYEKHLSSAAAFAAVASASGQSGAKSGGAGREDTSAYYSRAGVIDGAVVSLGRVRGVTRPYRMSFSLATPEGGGPVLLFTCDTAALPPGYVIIGARVANDIPAWLLPYPCRTTHPW